MKFLLGTLGKVKATSLEMNSAVLLWENTTDQPSLPAEHPLIAWGLQVWDQGVAAWLFKGPFPCDIVVSKSLVVSDWDPLCKLSLDYLSLKVMLQTQSHSDSDKEQDSCILTVSNAIETK